MVDLVLKGLRSPNEIVRHEFIQSFANLIDMFPNDEILSPFSSLRNPNEKDLDFFENSTHMQLHRRQRAFYRLAEQLASKQVTKKFQLYIFKIEIPSNDLYKFILPILNPYLIDVTSKTSALSDQAIKLFGEILRHMTWAR